MNPFLQVKELFHWKQDDMTSRLDMSRASLHKCCHGEELTLDKLVLLFVVAKSECKKRENTIMLYRETNDPIYARLIHMWASHKDIPENYELSLSENELVAPLVKRMMHDASELKTMHQFNEMIQMYQKDVRHALEQFHDDYVFNAWVTYMHDRGIQDMYNRFEAIFGTQDVVEYFVLLQEAKA